MENSVTMQNRVDAPAIGPHADQPCHDHGCSPCEGDELTAHTPALAAERWPWWVTGLSGGLQQAFYLCLERCKTEPKRIVIVGGCRQRSLAEYLAFQFPDAKIALLDPDATIVEQTKADIHCRFHFMHSTVEAINLPDDSIDLVIALQLADYTNTLPQALLPQALAELGRITKGHLILSTALPWRSRLVRCLPKVSAWLAASGFDQVNTTCWNTVLAGVLRYGKVVKYIEPLPWRMIAVEMRPIKEQKLVLK
jgi:hypothetical protein